MKKNNHLITSTLQNITVKIILISTIAIVSCQHKSQKLNNAIEKNKLVEILSLDSSIILDLKYATDDNFLGKPVYATQNCYLIESAATKLVKANNASKKLGLRIKIFDGYRPHSVQILMWEILPNPMYVADPVRGSSHNRGCAVDVTLVDSSGMELLMPTNFDDFTEKAQHDYMNLPEEAIRNRELLKKIMVDAGFVPLQSEWWHYSIPECGEYEILDMPL